jgi:hypothetical protein
MEQGTQEAAMTKRQSIGIGVVIAARVWASGITLTRAQAGHQPTNEQRAERAAIRNAARTRSRLLYLTQHPSADLVADIPLAVEPGSDDTFDDVRVVRFSDGMDRIELPHHERLTNQDTHTYSYITVDLSRKTYRTFHWQSLKPTDVEINRLKQYLAARGRTAEAAPLSDPRLWASAGQVHNARFASRRNETNAIGGSEHTLMSSVFRLMPSAFKRLPVSLTTTRALAQSPGCSGYFYEAIWTIDPVFIQLNLDYTEADWWVDGGYGWNTYGNIYGWAANPSSAGTHWYGNYEYPYYDSWPSWGTAWSQDDAEFYNDDFPPNAGQRVWRMTARPSTMSTATCMAFRGGARAVRTRRATSGAFSRPAAVTVAITDSERQGGCCSSRGHPRSHGPRMRCHKIRQLPPHLWVLVGPVVIVLAYLLGLAVLDLLGAGYLRSLAGRLFGM